jgi:DNA polymerase III delta subunit
MDLGKGIFLVTGNDEAAIEAAAKSLVAELAGADPEPGALEAFREREDFSGGDLLGEALAGMQAPPFLLERKTVWLHKGSGFASGEGGKKSAAKSADAQVLARLAETVVGGLPPGIQLVVSGPAAEKALGDAFRKAGGQIKLCQRPDPKDRNWQQAMTSFIRTRARDKNVTLEPAAAECLTDVLGVDTLRLDGELEKLSCYAGPGRAVTAADVLLLCQGEGGEISPFALTEALGARDLNRVWAALQAVLEREKNPQEAVLPLLRSLYGQFRSFLQIRVFVQVRKIKGEGEFLRSVESLAGEAKAEALRDGFEFITYHPFRVKKMYAMAMQYAGQELVRSVPLLRDAYQKCVTGGVSSTQPLLEELVVRLVERKRA